MLHEPSSVPVLYLPFSPRIARRRPRARGSPFIDRHVPVDLLLPAAGGGKEGRLPRLLPEPAEDLRQRHEEQQQVLL